MSIQRIIANNSNRIKNATRAATSVATSSFISSAGASRQGNGQVALSGAYTGSDDATFDIEIVGNIGAGRVSTPVFSGSGSGSISNILPGTLAAQAVTVTLADMGISTQKAMLEFYGITLQAKSAGAVGNAITINVTDNTTATAGTAALFTAISEGQEILNGVENNFNALTLTAKGELDPSSVRFTFGDDPQVFRQYKKFVGSDWEYHLVPPAPRAITAGATINTINGGYSISITDGSVSETYTLTALNTPIITLYDFLAVISTNSDLIEVIGTVVKDTQPQGMATIDLPLKTTAYSLPVTASAAGMPSLAGLDVSKATKTEKLKLECIDNSVLGAEVWSVTGSASGTLAQARTGIIYTGALYDISSTGVTPAAFTIPQWFPEIQTSAVASPAVTLNNVSYASRTEAETAPQILVRKGQIGIAGQPGTLTATYTKFRGNQPDCNALDALLSGFIGSACLGLNTTTGGEEEMALDPEYQSRLVALYQWQKTALENEVGLQTTQVVGISHYEVYMVALAVQEVYALVDLGFTHGGDVSSSAVFGSVEQMYAAITPGPSNAYLFYEVEIPGDERNFLYQVWQTQANAFQTSLIIGNTETLTGTLLPSAAAIPASTPGYYSVLSYIENRTVAASPITAITTLDIEVINTITDTLASCLAQIWGNLDGRTAWDDFFTYAQGIVTQYATINLGVAAASDYYSAINAYNNKVLATAGIVPGKAEGSAVSTGCWTSQDADYWQIDGYAPAYTNTAYISTKFSADGTPYSTKEFGFFIACNCPESLKYGDRLTIGISGGSTQSKTFQLKDTFEIPIIAGETAKLSGGVNGNDTVTWNVKGMTDGILTSYPVVNNAPMHYVDNATGLEFDMALGGIPFALGDIFSFSIEGGQFRWSKNSGSWSASFSLADTLLSDGLTAVFSPGANPSFVPGDTFSFKIVQPASPAHIATPDSSAWTFTAGGSITIAPAAAVTATALCIVHNLPAGTTITLSGLTTPTSLTTGTTGIEYLEFASKTVTALTLTIANAGSISYVYLGTPLTTEYAPASIELRRQWDMLHGSKSQFGGQYLGQGYAGKVAWNHFISKTEFDNHIAMIDYAKQNGDEPVIFVPHHLHPTEAFLCRIEADQVDMVDMMQFHPNDETNRVMSLTIPFTPVTK